MVTLGTADGPMDAYLYLPDSTRPTLLRTRGAAHWSGCTGTCEAGIDPRPRPVGPKVGAAAMAHFWASTPEIIDSVGYGSPLERFADGIVKEPIEFKNGVVHLPEGPGLGVEVDDNKLRKFALPIRVE